MNESFLHYLWQMQYFNKADLRTTDGEKIEILSPGTLNTHAGPDFANARVKIGDMGWVGSVEIHTHSSTWLEHHHDHDRAYDNVILHLVWQHDKAILRNDKTLLPTLELRGRVDEALIKTYRQLIGSSFSIPCQRSLPNIDELTKISMMERALFQRLERKANDVIALYEQNGNSWEETFYQLLARNFGFKVNAEPFYQLAKLLPLRILMKQANKLEHVEALLFGQAGFLETSKADDYQRMLQREHRLLAQKYSLQQNRMSKAQWRFLRLRPANFPSLRLAQFSAVLHQRQNLFSTVLESDGLKNLIRLFTAPIGSYWMEHYHFTKKSRGAVHDLGAASQENILINTVVPVWVAYGKQTDQQRFVDRAVEVLQELPAEENKITRTWSNLGMTARTAFDSQAMLELFNNFCQQNGCLNCAIGASLMHPTK